jgi:hypothetical protein
MADRSVETIVTFGHPFRLSTIDVEQPAGSYRVITDEVEIPGLSFLAYSHAATMLHVPAIGSKSVHRQVFTVGHEELDAALAADKQI